MLGQRLDDGDDATVCAMVVPRQVPRHDGLFDVLRCVSRVALGSLRRCLGPGGMVCIVALPPLVEPPFRAGQLPPDVLDLVCGKLWVEGLCTALFGVLGQRGFLRELRVHGQACHVFSLLGPT